MTALACEQDLLSFGEIVRARTAERITTGGIVLENSRRRREFVGGAGRGRRIWGHPPSENLEI